MNLILTIRRLLAEASRNFGLVEEVNQLRDEFRRLFGIDLLDDFKWDHGSWIGYHELNEEEADKIVFAEEDRENAEAVDILLRRIGITGPFRVKIILRMVEGEPSQQWLGGEITDGFQLIRQYSNIFRLTLILQPKDC